MLDKETLTALQETGSIKAANTAVLNSDGSCLDISALPSDYKVHDLEQYLTFRRRARGTMSTSSLSSFSKYCTNHADNGATVFVDKDAMSACAILNLGTPESPGHADNKAVIKAERTAAYRALGAIANGAGRAQKEVAEFLEDWPEYIKCFNESGAIKNSQAIAAVRKITIDSMRKLESEEKSLGASKSAFESVQASSNEPLPTTIYFECIPYDNFEQRLFVMRLGVLTGEATPKVNLRIVKAEQAAEEMAAELASKVSDELGGAIPVVLGTYSRAG